MKTAVLSDIHGNAYALEAVLDDGRRRGVERWINLGDSFYGPIAPRATFGLLQIEEMISICGNQDRQLYEASVEERGNNPTLSFVLDQLGNDGLNWLKLLPPEQSLEDGLYLCHGAPNDDLCYLLEDVRSGVPQLRDEAKIKARLGNQQAALILCGHSHLPRQVQLAQGQLLVNPGSVGLPAYCDEEPVLHRMENYSPHARYAIVEQQGSQWHVQQHAVPYDVAAAVAAARRLGREDWAYALATGRAQ